MRKLFGTVLHWIDYAWHMVMFLILLVSLAMASFCIELKNRYKLNWWNVCVPVLIVACILAGLFNVYWQIYYARPAHHPNWTHDTQECIDCAEKVYVTNWRKE